MLRFVKPSLIQLFWGAICLDPMAVMVLGCILASLMRVEIHYNLAHPDLNLLMRCIVGFSNPIFVPVPFTLSRNGKLNLRIILLCHRLEHCYKDGKTLDTVFTILILDPKQMIDVPCDKGKC